jgi:hypothetical protein
MIKSEVMKNVCVILLMIVASLFAKANSGDMLVSADIKAKTYCKKMGGILELSEKQEREIYKLRFELSLAINLACKEHKDHQEKLDKKITLAQIAFESGLKKVLNNEQFNKWDLDRKETYAMMNQHNQYENVATFELP